MPSLSDREFDPPLRIPFAPGTSPFRQKGHGYLGDFEYFANRVPGGPEAVLRHVTDDATRAFLSQRFVGSEWYDAYPCLTLHVVAARLAGVTFEEHRRRIGAFHAQAMNGVYRALLRVISNEIACTAWTPPNRLDSASARKRRSASWPAAGVMRARGPARAAARADRGRDAPPPRCRRGRRARRA